jgi:type II secretory pathway pseudopilin PulG
MRNKSGMTFLEVLIALFLFTLMVSAVFPVFLTTRKIGLINREFTEARQKAQTQIEWIYDQSKNLNYPDTLYQLVSIESFTCSGFSWTIDAITLEIIYNTPSSVVTCTKTITPYQTVLVFTRDETILTEDFIEITITINDVSPSSPLKLYETLYATGFLE